MKNKPKTSPRTKPPTPKHEPLAALISRVLSHPELPDTLRRYFGEGMTELFNSLNDVQQERIGNDHAHIAHLLAATAENAKGGRTR